MTSGIPSKPHGSQTAVIRFWDKVDKKGPEECWIWTGCKSRDGYGAFFPGGLIRYKSGKAKNVWAHRFSFELHTGLTISGDLRVLHHCDNPSCVNPDHLFLGTQADNVRDMVLKGRGPCKNGERNPNVKLTDAQVVEIRNRATGSYGEGASLAREYGISQPYMSKILRRKHRA